MSVAAQKKTFHQTSASIDPAEMAHFEKMAEDWWNPSGKFKPLHIMNGCRIRFITDEICAHFERDPEKALPLSGLRILDIGCGGGLLCEPMARLGAQVSGVDALEKNIKTAQVHADQSGLDIDYRCTSLEALVESGNAPFDVVLNMEVLEHVTDPAEFIALSAKMLQQNGITFCSTINRTAKAFTLAIFGAEYVLSWLPKGTHQYAKFIKPLEMRRMLLDAGLTPDDAVGMIYNPLSSSWKIGADTSVNYLVRSLKEGGQS